MKSKEKLDIILKELDTIRVEVTNLQYKFDKLRWGAFPVVRENESEKYLNELVNAQNEEVKRLKNENESLKNKIKDLEYQLKVTTEKAERFRNAHTTL